MHAKELQQILAREAVPKRLSGQPYSDLALRFRNLRRNGLLPKTVGKIATHLSDNHLAAGLLSIVATTPEYSGLTAKVLLGLKPVGGSNASFLESPTFGGAIAALFAHESAVDCVVEIRVSDAEVFKNAYGHATIIFRRGDDQNIAYYVPGTAISLFQPGAEASYDPTEMIPSVLAETIVRPSLFRKVMRERTNIQEREARFPVPTDYGVGDDEDDDERRERARREKLGVMRGSRFLNVGVDSQVTWPKEETVVEFEGYFLVLMPKTRRNTTSVHIDLYRNRLNDEEALTVVNRFLSMMSWCDDQHAVNHGGWSGNPVPVAVPKRDLAFTTAHHWIFDRRVPQTEEARKAIAIYREARNAEQNELVGYAVLGYYKIIELRHKGRSDTIRWFAKEIEEIREEARLSGQLQRFLSSFTGQKPQDYLYRACRTAVAHANKPYSLDPDDLDEIRRMHVAADILRELARRFIKDELEVSTCIFDGS